MTNNSFNVTSVLAVGASGSIGRHVVAQSLASGLETTALVRRADQQSLFPDGVRIAVADPTRPEGLAQALQGVNGIVFTQGTMSAEQAEAVDYDIVRNVLAALDHPARIALMTAVGVTKWERSVWKRRSERMVRASGLPYTIVRPGWFDYNEPDQHRIVMRQGDTHLTGDPADGQIARAQIAEVLLASLNSPEADHKTLELVADKGQAPYDLAPLFAGLASDSGVDGALDPTNLPVGSEPETVQTELAVARSRF